MPVKRRFGKTGMQVTALGFGGAEIGFNQVEQAAANRILNTALDAGLNIIDTAECYKESETLIGNAVGHRRDSYFLFTKMGHGKAAGLDYPDWSPELLKQSFHRSLQRLKTDCVDLLQLHTCELADLEKGEVIRILEDFKAQGKTRFIGYSGDNAAASRAVSSGLFDALQISVNIADQSAIPIIAAAQKADMGGIAKRPLANAAWITGQKPANSYAHGYWDRLQKLQYDFLSRPPSASTAHALRFTLSVPGVCTAIVGTANPARWQENLNTLTAGALAEAEFNSICNRWQSVAPANWAGLS